MAGLRRISSPHRLVFVALALALGFSTGTAYMAYSAGSPSGTTFYACLNHVKAPRVISVGTPITCTNGETLVTWMSYAPEALDAVFVNEGQTDSVSSNMIQYRTITDQDLSVESVGTGEIKDSGVTADDLAQDSVTNVEIMDGQVGVDDLADSSVGSGEIINGSVSSDDLAQGTINADNIDSGTVQQRVSGTCAFGYAMREIDESGGVSCEYIPDPDVYLNEEQVTITLGHTAQHFTSCNSGDVAISGGVRWVEGGTSSFLIIAESYQSSPDTWFMGVLNNNLVNTKVSFSVMCLDT